MFTFVSIHYNTLLSVFACSICSWWIILTCTVSVGLFSWKELPEVNLPALNIRPFSLRFSFSEVFVCMHARVPLGVQVSDLWNGSLGQSSVVSSSGPLNSVGPVFEREGRCSTFHWQTRGALCPFFHIQAWTSNSSYYSFSPVSPSFVLLSCWKALWATLTLGVFVDESRGWYPDVTVCFCLGSCACLWMYVYVYPVQA